MNCFWMEWMGRTCSFSADPSLCSRLWIKYERCHSIWIFGMLYIWHIQVHHMFRLNQCNARTIINASHIPTSLSDWLILLGPTNSSETVFPYCVIVHRTSRFNLFLFICSCTRRKVRRMCAVHNVKLQFWWIFFLIDENSREEWVTSYFFNFIFLFIFCSVLFRI